MDLKAHPKYRKPLGLQLVGKRIVLRKDMDDPYTKLKAGDTGVINHIDDAGTLHVVWDSGSTLGVLPDVDDYDVLCSACDGTGEIEDRHGRPDVCRACGGKGVQMTVRTSPQS